MQLNFLIRGSAGDLLALLRQIACCFEVLIQIGQGYTQIEPMVYKESEKIYAEQMEAVANQGASYFFNNSSNYTGNWGDLLTNDCGSLCFDVKYIYSGDIYQGTTPPTTMFPSITLEGAGYTASFVSWNTITVGDGWHTGFDR